MSVSAYHSDGRSDGIGCVDISVTTGRILRETENHFVERMVTYRVARRCEISRALRSETGTV